MEALETRILERETKENRKRERERAHARAQKRGGEEEREHVRKRACRKQPDQGRDKHGEGGTEEGKEKASA